MTPLLTAQQVAELLGVSDCKVYRLAKRGQLRSVVIGGSVRFRAEDLEEFVTRCAADGARRPLRAAK